MVGRAVRAVRAGRVVRPRRQRAPGLDRHHDLHAGAGGGGARDRGDDPRRVGTARLPPPCSAPWNWPGRRRFTSAAARRPSRRWRSGRRPSGPVDKIFGPGNAYVVEAKRQVFGPVAIDLLPGPSEVLVLADGSTRADWIAADLLAQAEHGADSTAGLVTDSEATAAGRARRPSATNSRLLHRQAQLGPALEGAGSFLLLAKRPGRGRRGREPLRPGTFVRGHSADPEAVAARDHDAPAASSSAAGRRWPRGISSPAPATRCRRAGRASRSPG